MAARGWLPGSDQWVDDDGTTWTRRKPRWLDERRAKRFMLRSSTLVVTERTPGAGLLWLSDPEARRQFWADHVADHLDDATGTDVAPNTDGFTYRASMWMDDTDRRLLLLSAMC